MKKTESVKAINKAYKTLVSIESAEDLKREKLTLSDYRAARDLFAELTTAGATATTFISAAADLFKRCGYIVTETASGLYKIAC